MIKRLTFLLLTGAVTIANAQDSRTIAPGVITAGDGDLYVMSADNALLATTIDGSERWRADVGHRPLLVDNGLLLTQVPATSPGRLELAVLRTADGSPVYSAQLDLPAEVLASVDDRVNSSFDVSATYRDGSWWLLWRYGARPNRGALLTEDPGMPGQGANAGAPAPADGQNVLMEGALSIAIGPSASDLSSSVVAPASVPSSVAAGLPSEPVALWNSRGLETPPSDVGGFATAVEESGNQVRLRRWELATGQEVASIPMNVGPSHVYNVSANSQFVAITQRTSEAFNRYRWSIHSMVDGDREVMIDSPYSIGSFDAIDGRVVYLGYPWTRNDGGVMKSEPLRLVAVDMVSGAEQWSLPVRDTKYRGVLPP